MKPSPATSDRPQKRQTTPSRRERQKADRRSRIYEAAIELFSQKGFAETTVQEITDHADVGKGTFFNYFASKDAILLEYYKKVVDELLAYAETVEASTVRGQFELIFRRGAMQARREGKLFEILIREIFARPAFAELDREIHERFLVVYSGLVERGMAKGELNRALDVALAARLVGDIFSSTALEWAFYEKAFSMEEVLLKKLEVLFQGLEARK